MTQNQNQEALKESEERFREMAENIREVFWLFDRNENRVIYVSPAYETIWGRSIGSLYNRYEDWAESIYPDDREYAERSFAEIMESGGGDVREYRIVRPDGSIRWVSDRGFAIIDADGTVRRIAGIAEDITERKKIEVALRANQKLLSDVFESIQDGISVLDKDLTIVRVNGIMRQWYVEKLPMETKKCYDIYHSRSVPCKICPSIRCMKTGKTESEIVSGPPGSSIEWVELFAFPIKDPITGAVTGVVEHVRDITEKRYLESQLRQVERMESIGTLAGGIAHDFNNLLMGIQGRTSLMLADLETLHPSHMEHLKEIENYVKSATELTNQLLGFARGGKYEIKPTDLNELIDKSATMFGRTQKEISIHKKFQADIWVVAVDQGQIDQVFLNIFVNAWHAMPSGGNLYIQTENTTLDNIAVKPYRILPGRYVKVSITDTGIGMDAETLKQIFDPFFTTKVKERGTGLGLPSAYGIIKNHDGIITAYSEKDKGAAFHIYLPVSDKVAVPEIEPGHEMLPGQETILLVDDEPLVIDVGEQLLEKLGYRVFSARNGNEALDLYKNEMEAIALVILDMIMPGLGGGETYDKLKEINPDIRVLLSSGYSIDGEASEILTRGCDGFIQKPFNLKQMSQKVREILDKR